MIDAWLHLIAKLIPLTSLVLDGHLGHHTAWRIVPPCQLHLISKRRSASALSMPYDGPYAGRGPPRTYGSKLEYRRIPEQSLTATTVENHLQTRVYQAPLRHKAFAPWLNVVIIVQTTLHTHAQAHVILCSRDLDLADDTLRDDYSRRFQIAFNCRDATQYGGLEDFMHITPTGVTHAGNLSWFMGKVAYHLQAAVRQHDPDDSLRDLKADGRSSTYVEETRTMLVAKPEPVL